MKTKIDYFCKTNIEAMNIISLFHSEDKDFSNKRASYSINKKGKQLTFSIFYKDKNALRAVKNSIRNNLLIFEKTKKLVIL